MRKLQCRVKLKNGKWVYGNLIIFGPSQGITFKYPKTINETFAFTTNINISAGVIKKTFGQFTGKKDKTRKKIYEGDLVEKYNGCQYLVEWDDETSGFILRGLRGGGKEYFQVNEIQTFLRIIGTLHDCDFSTVED